MNMRHQRLPYVLAGLLILAMLLSGLLVPGNTPVHAQDTAPTPAPAGETSQSSFPWLGILVLVIPAGLILWLKERTGQKDERIRAVSCLPVIDEKARPFRIPDADEE